MNNVRKFIAHDHEGLSKEEQDKLLKSINKVEMQLDWFHDFVDHVQTNRYNAYNYACEYADNQETNRIGENNGQESS